MWIPAAIALVFVSAAPGVVFGQTEQSGAPEPVLEGFWPTERMIESMVRRTALEAAQTYDLDEEQRRKIESQMLERWPRFLREHRRNLQPLLNDYLEASMGPEPPTREQMQAWATRALPLAEKLQEHIEAGNREIRSLLTPLQRVKFDSESVEAGAALEAIRERVSRWHRGDFTAAEMWQPPPGIVAPSKPQAEGTPAPPVQLAPLDPIEVELDAWDRYVADFIAAFKLDDGQQAAATSILRELKVRARAHRDFHRIEVLELERAIAAGRDADEAKVHAETQRLYGPIDAMFAELERRLATVPTQAQRRAATQPAGGPKPPPTVLDE
jgi:hypothetical protein